MNLIQFETNGLNVLVTPVPDYVDLFCVMQDILDGNISSFIYMKEVDDSIDLPEGDWTLHAVTDTITEDQAKLICPFTTEDDYDQYDYVSSYEIWFGGHDTAKDGLEEYLRSHGIDPDKKHVILICKSPS